MELTSLLFCLLYTVGYDVLLCDIAQKNHYLIGRSIKGCIKNVSVVIFELTGVIYVILELGIRVSNIWINVSGIIFISIYLCTYFARQRVRLKMTKRMIGTMGTTLSVGVILSVVFYFLCESIIMYCLLAFYPIVFIIAYMPICAYENKRNNKYIKEAKSRMEKYDGRVVGITGSYGKTEAKYFLRHILGEDVSDITPNNYNTEIGVAKYINTEKLQKDYFICEMGARVRGDVAVLCDMTMPDLGIITGVNDQHLEYFKTVENICDTKCELYDAVRRKGGKVIVNTMCAQYIRLLEHCKEAIIFIEKEQYDSLVQANKICDKQRYYSYKITGVSEYETEFVLMRLNEEKSYSFVTCLIGTAAIENICLVAITALELGIDEELIRQRIRSLSPVAHRFEVLTRSPITVIDDSYNSNSSGYVSALRTLRLFTGRKVVITGGVIELGKEQRKVNYRLGKDTAEYADVLIVVKRNNKRALTTGFATIARHDQRVYYARDLDAATRLYSTIREVGDVVLFENDIP